MFSVRNLTNEFKGFSFLSIIFLTLVTAFTHDEWSARFHVPILLFIISFAAVGLNEIVIKLNKY